MPAFVWIALGVFFVCLVGGGIWALVNGLSAWRRARPALERMNAESAALSERSTALERRLAALEPKTAQLQHDIARLSRAVTRARILLGAVHVQTVSRVARFFV
jgi:uncharacterized coiled-coil protein SlyX